MSVGCDGVRPMTRGVIQFESYETSARRIHVLVTASIDVRCVPCVALLLTCCIRCIQVRARCCGRRRHAQGRVAQSDQACVHNASSRRAQPARTATTWRVSLDGVGIACSRNGRSYAMGCRRGWGHRVAWGCRACPLPMRWGVEGAHSPEAGPSEFGGTTKGPGYLHPGPASVSTTQADRTGSPTYPSPRHAVRTCSYPPFMRRVSHSR